MWHCPWTNSFTTQLNVCPQRVQSQWRKPNDSLEHGCYLRTHADEGERRDCGGHVGYQVPKHCRRDSDWGLQKGLFSHFSWKLWQDSVKVHFPKKIFLLFPHHFIHLRLCVAGILATEPKCYNNFFVFFFCDHRSSVICQRTAPPHLSLLHASPRGSGNPSQSPSDPLVLFKLLVTTTYSTQRVIISLPWPDCHHHHHHHHPNHYPSLSVLNVQ